MLLTRYLDQRYDQAPLQEQEAFATLLNMDDPRIMAYLNGQEHSQSDAMSRLVKHIHAVYPHPLETDQS